jgi:Helix-turn-helix of DDE superfamily endonuclease
MRKRLFLVPMKYKEQLLNRTNFISLTSLEPEEFSHLLVHFAPLCEKYYRYHTTEGQKRKIICYQEHKSALLQGSGQKLFFLLVYLKNNPLQTFQAAVFNVSQSKVSKITHVLIDILNQTLIKMGLSPCRDGEMLHAQLQSHPHKVFTYDGMERGIQRNMDIDAQQEEYSGKKKHIK